MGVRLSGALRSRNAQAAAHSSRLILLVCAAVVSGLTVLQVSGAGAAVLAVHWLCVLVLLLGALACTLISPAQFDRLGIGVVIATCVSS